MEIHICDMTSLFVISKSHEYKLVRADTIPFSLSDLLGKGSGYARLPQLQQVGKTIFNLDSRADTYQILEGDCCSIFFPRGSDEIACSPEGIEFVPLAESIFCFNLVTCLFLWSLGSRCISVFLPALKGGANFFQAAGEISVIFSVSFSGELVSGIRKAGEIASSYMYCELFTPHFFCIHFFPFMFFRISYIIY